VSEGNLKVVQLAPPAAPVGGSPEGTGRCRPIIMLAHALDLNVVAEGVEFAANATFL
jgi:EAL domain-containing protein (putative c-di-GMP-specific phosphodiesterase class I)